MSALAVLSTRWNVLIKRHRLWLCWLSRYFYVPQRLACVAFLDHVLVFIVSRDRTDQELALECRQCLLNTTPHEALRIGVGGTKV